MIDPCEERDPLEELAEEFLDRYRRGEAPTVGDYLARCPDRREEFHALLSALMVVEELKPGSDATGGFAPVPAVPTAVGGGSQGRLGDFRILREVGRGGMGVVYEAEQESLGRRVALKVLASWAGPDSQKVRRFLREASAAARLHHPNIVPIFAVGEHDGRHYYAMQFIRGLGLDRVLDEVRYLRSRTRGDRQDADGCPPIDDTSATLVSTTLAIRQSAITPLARGAGEGFDGLAAASPPRGGGPPVRLPDEFDLAATDDTAARYREAVARVGAAVAEALQYAHDHGMLHRDIKPSNLLLDEGGKVWIMDFGLVKVSDDADLTDTGDLVGTLRYMAPERFRGRCDARSDVYALGLTLYELLALQPAFRAPDRHRLIHQITQGEPPPLRRLVPALPRDLETIIHTAIAREPADRYYSAGGLADDLRRWLQHQPIRARPVRPHERLVKWTRRNPAVAALSAVSILAAATALAALSVGYTRAAAALHRERQVSYSQRVALAERAWSGNDVGRAEALLDDTPRDFRGWEWGYLKRLCHSDLASLRAHAGVQPNAVSFSPDGTLVATAGEGGTVSLWEIASGHPVRSLPGHTGGIYGLAFSPDGAAIASAGRDGCVRIWEVATGRLQFSGPPRPGREALTVAYSPDGAWLASGTGVYWETVGRADHSGELALWEARSGRLLRTLPGHAGSVHHVAFSPEGGRLASAGGDGAVKVWDLARGEAVLELRGHDGVVMGVAYRADGRQLASAGLDGSLRIWDGSSGDLLLTVREPGEQFMAVAFSPDGRRLAAAGRSWAVTVWDAATGHRLEAYRGHDREVMGVAYSPDGRRLATAGFDGVVRLWDPARGQGALVLPRFAGAVTALALDPRGERLATADGSGPARVWDPATGREVMTLRGRAGPHTSLAFSPDGSLLATAGRRSGIVELWDAAAGRKRRTLGAGPGAVTAVAFRGDGRLVAVGNRDGTVQTWDVADGRPGPRFRLDDAAEPVTALAFVADGRQLAASTGDSSQIDMPGAVTVWDAATGRVVRVLRGHVRGIGDLAPSPDGRRLATAGWDGTVRVWDAISGEPLRTLAIRGLLVWAVAFSPDGRRVVAADNIGRMMIWDAESGHEVLTLRGHADRIYDLAFSGDGRLLATAGRDATAKVWDATPLPPAVPPRVPVPDSLRITPPRR